jgi:phage gp36-like protein
METLCQIVYCTASFVGRTQLMCRAIAFHLLKNRHSLNWKILSLEEDDIPFLEKVASGEFNVGGLQNSYFIEIGFRKNSNYVKPIKKNCGEVFL